MALTAGDILQVSLRGTLFEQRMLTVLHYRVITGSASGTVYGDVLSWAQYFGGLTGVGELLTVYLATCCPEYLLEDVRVQRVAPDRSAYAVEAVNLFGSNANACRTANISASITKRGNGGGRWATGRVQMPGLPSDNVLDGNITVGALIDYSTLANSFSGNHTNAGITQSVQPVIFNPGRTPNYVEILNWLPQNTARTMHRRTLRLGE